MVGNLREYDDEGTRGGLRQQRLPGCGATAIASAQGEHAAVQGKTSDALKHRRRRGIDGQRRRTGGKGAAEGLDASAGEKDRLDRIEPTRQCDAQHHFALDDEASAAPPEVALADVEIRLYAGVGRIIDL